MYNLNYKLLVITVAIGILSWLASRILREAPKKRLENGIEIPITEVPFQVSIREIYDDVPFGDGFLCVGSLIATDVVLTAAHCWYNDSSNLYNASELKVVGGQTDLTSNDTNTFFRDVLSFEVHKSYKHGRSYSDDIALLKLKTKVTLTDTVKLIDLSTSEIPGGTKALITGWRMTVNYMKSPLLRSSYVQILDATECNKTKYLNGAVKSGMFCAVPCNDDICTCQCDSGGPLIFNNTLYGITSHGFGCALTKIPGVYTDVSFYRDWILENIISTELGDDGNNNKSEL